MTISREGDFTTRPTAEVAVRTPTSILQQHWQRARVPAATRWTPSPPQSRMGEERIPSGRGYGEDWRPVFSVHASQANRPAKASELTPVAGMSCPDANHELRGQVPQWVKETQCEGAAIGVNGGAKGNPTSIASWVASRICTVDSSAHRFFQRPQSPQVANHEWKRKPVRRARRLPRVSTSTPVQACASPAGAFLTQAVRASPGSLSEFLADDEMHPAELPCA